MFQSNSSVRVLTSRFIRKCEYEEGRQLMLFLHLLKIRLLINRPAVAAGWKAKKVRTNLNGASVLEAEGLFKPGPLNNE